jgi:hypothetical protein
MPSTTTPTKSDTASKKPYAKPSPLWPSARASIVLDPNSRPKSQKRPRARTAYILFRDSIIRQEPDLIEKMGKMKAYRAIEQMWDKRTEKDRASWYNLEKMEKEDLAMLKKRGPVAQGGMQPIAEIPLEPTLVPNQSKSFSYSTSNSSLSLLPLERSLSQPQVPLSPFDIPPSMYFTEEDDEAFQRYIQIPAGSTFV